MEVLVILVRIRIYKSPILSCLKYCDRSLFTTLECWCLLYFIYGFSPGNVGEYKYKCTEIGLCCIYVSLLFFRIKMELKMRMVQGKHVKKLVKSNALTLATLLGVIAGTLYIYSVMQSDGNGF